MSAQPMRHHRHPRRRVERGPVSWRLRLSTGGTPFATGGAAAP